MQTLSTLRCAPPHQDSPCLAPLWFFYPGHGAARAAIGWGSGRPPMYSLQAQIMWGAWPCRSPRKPVVVASVIAQAPGSCQAPGEGSGSQTEGKHPTQILLQRATACAAALSGLAASVPHDLSTPQDSCDCHLACIRLCLSGAWLHCSTWLHLLPLSYQSQREATPTCADLACTASHFLSVHL